MTGSRSSSSLPGLALTAALAAAALLLHDLPVPPFSIGEPARHPIDAMLVAIVLGIALRNLVGLHPIFAAGTRTAVLKLLPIAIVLIGAKLDFFDVLRISGQALVASVICVGVALGFTLWLCRVTRIGRKLGLLLAVGTAICGGTAIAVTAPIIEADDSETAFAVTTITLFGLISLFLFPFLGAALGMSQLEFGAWAGTAIHSTPQVVAAGFTYGPEAGEVATVVKLVRVLLLAPVVVVIGAWYARQKRRRQEAHVTRIGELSTLFPPFIFGFLLVALASTLHFLPDVTLHLQDSPLWERQELPVTLSKLVTSVSGFLMTMSMAGVGLGVHLRGLATVGLRAILIGAVATGALAVFSYALVSVAL